MEPYFLSSDPQKITPNHLDFSNGLFVSEIKEQLYLHSEVPCWFGMTNKGKIAIMIEVDSSQEFNANFAEKCKKVGIDVPYEVQPEDDDEVLKETPREATVSPSMASSCEDPEFKSSGSKKLEKRKELKFEHLTKMKHDTKLLLVKDFLHSPLSPIEYLQKIAIKTRHLDGFNFLVGDLAKGLYFYSNKDRERCIYELVQGEYVIGPIPGLDTAINNFGCVEKARKEFLKIMTSLNSHDIEEVPTSYDELSKWVKAKQEIIEERRRKLNSAPVLQQLFGLTENEEKLPIDGSDDALNYIKYTYVLYLRIL